MKYILYSLIAGSVFIACNNDKTTDNEKVSESTAPAEKSVKEEKECYLGISGKDSVILNLESAGNKITGTLSYKFFEKDSNHGTLEGTMHGDTLLANYSFASEGVNSVRQVAFLKNGNELQEGYGEMEEKGGSMKFKSPASLKFGKGFKLEKIECKQ